MDSISRLRDNAFLVRRTQTARPFRVFWSDRFVRCARKKKKICLCVCVVLYETLSLAQGFGFVLPTAVEVLARMGRSRDGSRERRRRDRNPSRRSRSFFSIVGKYAHGQLTIRTPAECRYCFFHDSWLRSRLQNLTHNLNFFFKA